MGRFCFLGKEGSDLIDQVVAARTVGGTNRLFIVKNDVCKYKYFQITVITQVAISHRMHRHRLALRDRQAARGKRKEAEGLMLMT